MEKDLLKLADSQNEFNTNNSWGFGGGYGTEYVFDGLFRIRKGKACTRHMGEFPFTAVYDAKTGERIMDEKKLKPEQIKQLLEIIQVKK